MNKFVRIAALSATGLVVTVARAADAGPDISAVTTAATNVGIVGAAVFAVYVAVKGFKWIRSAL
jgi:Inovirus Coat protein B